MTWHDISFRVSTSHEVHIGSRRQKRVALVRNFLSNAIHSIGIQCACYDYLIYTLHFYPLWDLIGSSVVTWARKWFIYCVCQLLAIAWIVAYPLILRSTIKVHRPQVWWTWMVETRHYENVLLRSTRWFLGEEIWVLLQLFLIYLVYMVVTYNELLVYTFMLTPFFSIEKYVFVSYRKTFTKRIYPQG